MPQLTDEEYLRLLWEARQGNAPAYAPPAPVARPRANYFWSFVTLVVVAVMLLLAADRLFPGSVAALVGRVAPGATVALNGTPVVPLPTAGVTVAPMASQVVVREAPAPIVQYVPAPPIIIIASPTPPPAGVSASVDQSGVTLAVSNGAPAPTAAPPPTELPKPGEPGFVESFKVPTPLPEGNLFLGCLPGRHCGP